MQTDRIKKQRPTPFEIRRAPTSLKWQLVRAAGRPKDVVAFDEAVVTFFLESADLLGVPKSVAAVYGVCFASPHSLSFSDISDRLGVSQGSISHRFTAAPRHDPLFLTDHPAAALAWGGKPVMISP